MTQGFKMRSRPFFICSALWPRYSCGEEKQPLFSALEMSVGIWRKFSYTYTGDEFEQAELNVQSLKGKWEWRREKKVLF